MDVEGPGHDLRTIPLSPMDNVMPRIFANFVLCLPLRPGQPFGAVHDVLRGSLAKACDEVPVLRYRVYSAAATDGNTKVGQLEARPDQTWLGPEFIYNDVSSTWPAYSTLFDNGFPQRYLVAKQILPKAAVEWDPADMRVLATVGTPALTCQANYVESGLILAIGIFHSVIDGMSFSVFLKRWASHARALQGDQDIGPLLVMHPESCDYSLLERIWPGEKDRRSTGSEPSLSLQRLLGITASNPVEDAESRHQMESRIFYVSAASLQTLANDCKTVPGASNETANDALMALLWRCLIRARANAAGPSSAEYAVDVETSLDTTLDGRALLGDLLPVSYMGTLIFITTSSMSIGHLLKDTTSLREVAGTIRRNVNAISRDRAVEALGLAAAIQNYNELCFPFQAMKGTEVCITSLLTLSVSDTSFGRKLFRNNGRIDSVRAPTLEFGSRCRRFIVLPMQASGGCELLIEMKKDEIAALEADEEFCQYAGVV